MNNVKRMTNIAMIAAVYFVLSMSLQSLSFNFIQIRIAEALIVTAIISKDGIYGTTIGCLITNAIGVAMGLSGFGGLDIVFGTLLTLLSSISAYALKDYRITKVKIPLLSLMMPVLFNAIGLPIVFAFAFHQNFILSVYFTEFFFIFVGQFVSCVLLGAFVFYKTETNLARYLNS